MGRVISISNPAQRRNSFRRTIAEILRHLMLKRELDEEAKDMAATVVFSLRGIAETIETSTEAWEKRNYYLKADRFRRQWNGASVCRTPAECGGQRPVGATTSRIGHAGTILPGRQDHQAHACASYLAG